MTSDAAFYEAIDDIIAHIKTDFIGSIEAEEVLKIEEPLSRYSLGILWARPKDFEMSMQNNDTEELFEDTSEEIEELKSKNIFKPSTMGISFCAESHDKLNISFSYAVYHHQEQRIIEHEKKVNQHCYFREARQFSTAIIVPDKVCNQIISDESQSDLIMYLSVRKIDDCHRALITVSVLNKKKSGHTFVERNTNALFQCELSISGKSGFLPVYKKNFHASLEEERNEMLYYFVNNYSYGHGCSSIYTMKNGIVNRVKSEFIPQFQMLQMMPKLLEHSECLYMKYCKHTTPKIAFIQLYHLID